MSSLAALRTKLGYSQQELADVVGVSRNSIARYERRRSTPDKPSPGPDTPSPANRASIAAALGVSVDDLWPGSQPRYLDGPKLAAWIEERLEGTSPAPSQARRLRAWRRGSLARVHVVDEWLMRLSLLLSDVPKSFYIE